MRLYFGIFDDLQMVISCWDFSINAFCWFLFDFWNDYPSASSTSDLGAKSPEIRGVTQMIR